MHEAEAANLEFDSRLREGTVFVDCLLKRLITEQPDIDENVRAAMTYSLVAPGKRVRSVLVLWACELVGGRTNATAETAAAAIEMVHTYSLIHDDLPAMDDDDMRRGQPTCHRVFNEATAILAGDALLTLAFQILASDVTKPRTAVRLIRELAEAAGPAGMIAGQMADLRSESRAGDIGTLEYIHTNKTAKMFRCAAAMGGICGGATDRQMICLRDYGLKIGLGFQIADDILDVSASSQQLGKTAGKDEKARKCTYPAVVGLEEAGRLADRLAHEAVDALEPFGPRAEPLRELALALLRRTR